MKLIQIRVKPGARVSRLDEVAPGQWVAKLRSPPVDGRANQELIERVAERFGCAKSAVAIKSGAASRVKWVRIAEA